MIISFLGNCCNGFIWLVLVLVQDIIVVKNDDAVATWRK